MLDNLHKPFLLVATLVVVTANLFGNFQARGAETPTP